MFCLIPAMVILYYKRHRIFIALSWAMFIGGMALIFGIWYHYNLKVAVTTLEDFYMFSKIFRPPWTKLMAFGLAMVCGSFYAWYDERYRNMSPETKRRSHPILNWFEVKREQNLKQLFITFAFLGFGMLLMHF